MGMIVVIPAIQQSIENTHIIKQVDQISAECACSARTWK